MPDRLLESVPLLSIITVTLNDPSGLRETIESVVAQQPVKKLNFEQIVVDGLSSYDVKAMIVEKGSDAKLIQERDTGIYDAMNRGTRAARGDYLLYLNGGDRLADPTVLKAVEELLERERPDFLYGDSLERQLDGSVALKRARGHQSAKLGMFTHHQSMIFSRDLIQKNAIAYDLRYPIAADYEFTLHNLKYAKRILRYEGPIATFACGGVSQIQPEKGRIEQFKIRSMRFQSIRLATLIYVSQVANQTIRNMSPKLYWFLRSAWIRMLQK